MANMSRYFSYFRHVKFCKCKSQKCSIYLHISFSIPSALMKFFMKVHTSCQVISSTFVQLYSAKLLEESLITRTEH